MPHCLSIYSWKILLEEPSIIIISFRAVCWRLVRWISWLSNEKSVFLLKVLHEIVIWKTQDLTFKRIQLPGAPISGTFLDIQKPPHFQQASSTADPIICKKVLLKLPQLCSAAGNGDSAPPNSFRPSLSQWGRFQHLNLCIFTRQKKDSTHQISPLLLQKKAWPRDKWARRFLLPSSYICFHLTSNSG